MGVKMVFPGMYQFLPGEDDDSARYDILARVSGMPLDTRLTKRLCTFEIMRGREEGLKAAMAFIKGEIEPPLLLLYGEPGRSKTHLALAIGWCFLAQLKSVAYYQVAKLLDALRQGYGLVNEMKDSFEAVSHFIDTCHLLVLDDLAVHRETDWAVERLDTIVNHRYERRLSTVITANTLEISDRILDRCKEGRIVLLQGESYREILQRRRHGH